MRRGAGGWALHRALLALGAAWLVAAGCGPGGGKELPSERLFLLQDSRWWLEEVAISPDGRWAAAAAYGGPDLGTRVFLVELASGRWHEARPSWEARGELLIEPHPGIKALEWDQTGLQVRLPARSIGGGGAVSHPPSGRRQETEYLLPKNAPWLEVHLIEGQPGELMVNDSLEARQRPVRLPVEFDPRLKVEVHSRSTFDLLDHERGDRQIARFRGYMNWLDPRTATISPDGSQIGITVGREAFGNNGPRGMMLDRRSGSRRLLADWVVSGVRWHPFRPEAFGISKEVDGGTVLMRWRY